MSAATLDELLLFQLSEPGLVYNGDPIETPWPMTVKVPQDRGGVRIEVGWAGSADAPPLKR